MSMSSRQIALTEDDLKEIFSLFTSSTKYERSQVYDKNSGHYFLDVEPFDEYSLTEEKREYALDAWRAVIYFLHSKGYSLCKDGERRDLSFIEDDFIA
jgi:hypothetical protein